MAILAGLKPLADALRSGRWEMNELATKAQVFVKGSIKTVEEALQGAKDILAESYSDDPQEREYWRKQLFDYASFEINGTKTLQAEGLFAKLSGKFERINTIPSHRYLAMMRGVAEKELSVKISYDKERVEKTIVHYHLPKKAKGSKIVVLEAYLDGFKRLLFPSLEREIHALTKERCDTQAIATFGKNLSQLLTTPPVMGRVILGVDPAYRSGCKLAVVDAHGKYLAHSVIYPTQPLNDYTTSAKIVKALIQKYAISGIAIGNGTASRETQAFFARFNQEEGDEDSLYRGFRSGGFGLFGL